MQQERPKPSQQSNFQVLLFIILLCFVAGLILATVSFALRNPQKEAKEFDQSKQMLIAAKILSPSGYFEILDKDGKLTPAVFNTQKKILESTSKQPVPMASDEDIKNVAKLRIRPLLTNKEGEVFTLESKEVELTSYLEEHKETGYHAAPLKLVYVILQNTEEAEKVTEAKIAGDLSQAYAFVLPVSGFGLWAPIYGFLAIFPDGDTVIGTTWYEHAETPGLGANITEPWWQKQFYGKLVFQEGEGGNVDFKTDPMGIIVVKGKVRDVYGNSPKAKSAVDGMSGATLTGDGVTAAYRNSLEPYRAFLIKIHNHGRKENTPSKLPS